MMDAIFMGKFKGKECYSVKRMELIEYIKEENEDNNIIYIIENGDMILNNKIIGNYDGNGVEEYEVKKDFFFWNEEEEEEKINIPGVDLDFSQYSRVVDEFFEKMK